MKRLLFIALFFFLMCNFVGASGSFMVGGCPATTGALCSTETGPQDMETYASDVLQLGTTPYVLYTSSMFVANETTSICKICSYVKSSLATAPAFDVTVLLYTNDTSTNPDQPLEFLPNGISEAKPMAGNLTNSWQWLCWEFTGTKPIVTIGDTYHALFLTSGTSTTPNPILYMGKDSTCSSKNIHRAGLDLSWIPVTSSACAMMRLYK